MKITTKMANVLVDLSDPVSVAEFRRDPDSFLEHTDLSMEEKAALVSSDMRKIRFFARGISEKLFGDEPGSMPRVVAALALDTIETISTNAANVVSVAADSDAQLFIDRDGNAYALVADETHK